MMASFLCYMFWAREAHGLVCGRSSLKRHYKVPEAIKALRAGKKA